MECRVSELRYKEIINVSDGSRYGWVGMWRWIWRAGRSGRWWCRGLRLFGLLGREEDRVFPWEAVRRIGADTILVETPPSAAWARGIEVARRGGRGILLL